LLHGIFTNFTDFSTDVAENGILQPDRFDSSFVIDFTGYYALLYNALSIYDWSFLYNEMAVYAAIGRLNVAVTQAVHLAVPSGYIRKHKHPPWFPGKLKCYIKHCFMCGLRSLRLVVFMADFFLP
jgi:hypothetical protein